MTKKIFAWILLWVSLDQISKFLITSFMKVGQSIAVLSDFFHITYVQNTGAAFSILEGNRIFFILISFGVILFLFYFIKKQSFNKIQMILYTALIGGIIGNLIDRIWYGYVIDFLDFTIFSWSFAIFNLADCFIVLSILLLLFLKEDTTCKK